MSKRNANGKKKLDRGESLATMKKVLHYLAAYRVLFVLSLLLAARKLKKVDMVECLKEERE